MQETNAVNTIQSVAMNVIDFLQEYGVGVSHYASVENKICRYYSRTLKGFHMPSMKWVNVDVDFSSRIWAFPPDYIKYVIVAYRTHGRLFTLTVDNSIDNAQGIDGCDYISQAGSPDLTQPTIQIPGYWFNGAWTNPQYAYGGGNNVNYYKVDNDNQWIRFAENLPVGKAVIGYLSTGQVGSDTLVPAAYYETLFWNGVYEMGLATPNMPKHIVAEAKNNRLSALWDANRLTKSATPTETYDEILKQSGFKLR